MFNDAEAHKWWQVQAQKGENPCHYHNPWQDAYAFRMRTRAFHVDDFKDAKQVVDIGCGIGEYTEALSHLTDAHFVGFDFPFNVEIARKQHAGNSQLEFHDGALPHPAVKDALKDADVAFTTTTYVHLAGEARRAFYEYVSGMKSGSRVLLLEYMPDVVPGFQKKVPTKQVETLPELKEKFRAVGFSFIEARPVNYIDSFFFFHFGKNAFSYYVTVLLEPLAALVGVRSSKYKLVVFRKNSL